MNTVTREDVIALLTDEWIVTGRCWENYGGGEEYCSHEPLSTEAEAYRHRDEHHTESADVWGNTEDATRRADALIAAFPHLVGEVVEIDTEHSTYDLRTQGVYKVYAPWKEVEG